MKIGFLGYGHYGKMGLRLVRRFTETVQVVVFDPLQPEDGHMFVSLGSMADCDAIIFAVPMQNFENAVQNVLLLPNLREDMVFVNVCSDQQKSGETLAALAGSHPYICLHTPWGPEAYSFVDEVVSLLPPIVVTKLEIDAYWGNRLLEFVKGCGFRLAIKGSEEHDTKLAGRWMFIAHLICQLLERMSLFDEDCSAAPLSFQNIVRGARMLRRDKPLFLDLWNRVPACHDTFNTWKTATHELEIEKEVHASGK